MHRRLISLARAVAVLAGTSVQLACGFWQSAGGEPLPDPSSLIPRLFDTALLYREMGLLTAGEPVTFVAGVRWLAGPEADSTLAVVGVSLSNDALSFRRTGEFFEARYRVDVVFRREAVVVQQVATEEAVRVASFTETQRADESLVFQRFLLLPSGPLSVSISVRDVYGAGVSRTEGSVVVPAYGERLRLSSLVPVYRGSARSSRSEIPEFVVNPRATVPYGSDTLSLYLEAYGVARPTTVILRALLRSDGSEVWRDTLALHPGSNVVVAVARIPTSDLPVGVLRFDGLLAGSADTVRAPALVSFSDEWAVANFEQTLALLRFFGPAAQRRALLEAPLERRAALWKEFWRDTDPDPTTPENEAINEYFRRLLEANERFGEVSEAGWLTDRGEVFIALGEPDGVLDSGSDYRARGPRVIRWSYTTYRLALEFVDETGFGRFRLTPSSRAAFLAARDEAGRQ
jgi:GWxTD domain-containing protein